MNRTLWVIRMLFSKKEKLSEQDNLDWNWWLYVELPYWWYTRPIYQAFQKFALWMRTTLGRNEQSDDELPF